MHHKAIGVAGMMLIGIGSATYMLLAEHLMPRDPDAISRTIQGFLSGIGFLVGAVIFITTQDPILGVLLRPTANLRRWLDYQVP
jgi:uncharacterized membrane protein YhiD involved in acid resistance